MSWQPGEALLFQQPDTATGLSYLCFYELTAEQTLIDYRWQITPAKPDQFSIESSGSGVRLSASHLAGLFVPEFIDYRDGERVRRVADWPQVPQGKDLIEFRPSAISRLEYTLSVTVRYSEKDETTGQSVEKTDTHSWRCVVLHDYSSGRQKLLEYMNASRH
ncbi:hypothetical protein ACOCGL_003413 [Vibrio cholerae]